LIHFSNYQFSTYKDIKIEHLLEKTFYLEKEDFFLAIVENYLKICCDQE